jgi:hypothetical protein
LNLQKGQSHRVRTGSNSAPQLSQQIMQMTVRRSWPVGLKARAARTQLG